LSNELQSIGGTVGQTRYAYIRSASAQTWLRSDTGALEAYNASNLTAYKHALTETPAGSGNYVGNLNAATPDGTYTVDYRVQSGGAPAIGDVNAGAETISRSGSAPLNAAALSASMAAMAVSIAAVPTALLAVHLESGGTPITLADALRIIGAYGAGNTDATQKQFKALGDPTKTRIQYTKSGDGSRVVILTLTP
jgi:hypothetical protein